MMRRVVSGILRFFLPWACAGCRTPLETLEDSGFCGRCWLAIPRIDGLVCKACGLPLKDGGELCFACRSAPLSVIVRAATLYRYPMQGAIHRFKYYGRQSLGRLFRLLMEYAWEQYPEIRSVDWIVPVPLHRATAYNRGYNQAAILAQGLASVTALPTMDLLQRNRKTTPQFRLKKARRLTNLQDAFALRTQIDRLTIKRKDVLLVDDVCTTGATLKECAQVLKKAGIRSVKALVLSRDP